MLGLFHMGVSSTFNLLEVGTAYEAQMTIMVMVSSCNQCFLLCRCSSCQGLHAAPELALRCHEQLIWCFFIELTKEGFLMIKSIEVPASVQ